MALNLAGVQAVPYLGLYTSFPIGDTYTARLVPLYIDWASYGVGSGVTSAAVKANFVGNAPAEKLAQISAIYIDNLNSNVPVYVYFPDTRYTIAAQPQSTGWFPVITKQKEFVVYADGFTSAPFPTTNIFAVDKFVPGFLDIAQQFTYPQYKASPVIQRGDNILTPGWAAPALGDQIQSIIVSPSATPAGYVDVELFGGTAATAGKYVYLLAMDIGSPWIATTSGVLRPSTQVHGSSSGLLYQGVMVATSVNNSYSLFRMSGMQLRLSGDETWNFSYYQAGTYNASSTINAAFVFTISDT